MPIPKPAGEVLSPFLKDDPTRRDRISPYLATPLELVERYATSTQRIRILEGLLRYRAELRRIGLSAGFQWIDGSFVETPAREPNDIDIVTVSSLPTIALHQDDEALFDVRQAKMRFLCDAHFVDLAGDPLSAISDAAYWFSLFSHQKRTRRWKGLVQLDLVTADADASARERLEALKRDTP